jgi:hypothetical protein
MHTHELVTEGALKGQTNFNAKVEVVDSDAYEAGVESTQKRIKMGTLNPVCVMNSGNPNHYRRRLELGCVGQD